MGDPAHFLLMRRFVGVALCPSVRGVGDAGMRLPPSLDDRDACRVMLRRLRSAVTGRYTASGDPATTVVEHDRPRIPAAVLGKRLASYADKGSGTEFAGEAYDADPDFWNVEATRLEQWLHR